MIWNSVAVLPTELHFLLLQAMEALLSLVDLGLQYSATSLRAVGLLITLKLDPTPDPPHRGLQPLVGGPLTDPRVALPVRETRHALPP